MKKYDQAIVISLLIYIVIATASAFLMKQEKEEQNAFYKVEINRIMNELETTGECDLQEKKYNYIKEVDVLSMDANVNQVEEFLAEDSKYNTQIRVCKYNNGTIGYVRFRYTQKNDMTRIIIVCEVALFLLEAVAITIILIVRSKVIIPFCRLNIMPQEMSNGHYTMDVMQERKDYFKDFLSHMSRLKDSLELSRKRELHLQKEKKLLLLSISHDIKTPLNTIQLYAKALLDQMYATSEEKERALGHIIEKTGVIEKYVEDIMKASREDILELTIERGEFYLKDLIDKVYSIYSEKCKRRMTELTIGSYHNRIIIGDKERLFEVFENIIENAFKYGDGRKIEISFSEEEYHLLIRIFNTGEPVSENDFNHIFDSFFRGSNAQRQAGNGLGLYICREIMLRQGYEIFAEKSDAGMEFVLVL